MTQQDESLITDEMRASIGRESAPLRQDVERLGIRQIATLDGDFAVYRLHGRSRFQNVFPVKEE